MDFVAVMNIVVEVIEGAGVAALLIGGVAATLGAARRWRRDREHAYALYRRDLGRSILVALEFLVAADIVRTVAIEPTLESVAVLGLVVLVRTALSFSLEAEINGEWPWQRTAKREATSDRA